jgi:hypothetical protein
VRVIVAAQTDVVPSVSGFGTVQPGKTWKAVVQAAGEIEYVHPDLKRGRNPVWRHRDHPDFAARLRTVDCARQGQYRPG